MTAHVLGISAFYHDSAACLVRDGDIVAAAQEERFTRKKHDAAFPAQAIAYCLREGGIEPRHLDLVAFYEKPLLKLDRLFETYLAFAPRGFVQFTRALPLWLHDRLRLVKQLERGLPGFAGRYVFPEHHESHAASAFFPSPFASAAILTLDGVGEWATASTGTGEGNRVTLDRELRFPHSLGLLYSAITAFAGFKVNSGEYKLMGLAPFGRPRFSGAILDNVVDLKLDGSFRLDLRYFAYCHGRQMTTRRMEQLLEGPPRAPEAPVTQREMDIAASIQVVTEEIIVRIARQLARASGRKALCLAGGVALNCVANARIRREGCFDDIWIQPASGDAGGALGAALIAWHHVADGTRPAAGAGDRMKAALLGPRCEAADVRASLDRVGAVAHHIADEDVLLDRICAELEAERVVGFVHGRMEYGPRSLGSRSILGDARSPRMQSVMNRKIKFRESFRPFAPAVLREVAHEWFEVPPGEDNPYMLVVAQVAEQRRVPLGPVADGLSGIELVQLPRSSIPAVTHIDLSARLQTVDERHGRFYRLLRRFHARTGCPVLINTSFNVRGEPIVCTAEDAYRCFLGSHIDVLVVEHELMFRHEQTLASDAAIAGHVARFTLD